jgi:RNA polymerase sigma-70 factor (sigma-E family)
MRRELDERFAAYVRDRGDHHLRVAVLLTGDWHAGEDLLQASLAKLYRAWPRLDTTADPDAYLRRVMVNTRRSWWRTRWRQETPTAVIPESATAEDFEDRHILGVLVRQALARLPRQQRIVVVLRYCADLPEAEVAAVLGCAAGTVKAHAHRGIQRLRDLLGGELALGCVNVPQPAARDNGRTACEGARNDRR